MQKILNDPEPFVDEMLEVLALGTMTKASRASAQDQPMTTHNTAAATTSSSTNTPRAAAITPSGRPARVGDVMS